MTGAAAESTPSGCVYRLHQRGADRAGHRVTLHAHAAWQLEVVLSGRVSVTVEEEAFSLGPGFALLVPRGRAHRLDYVAPVTRYVSIKFSCDRPWSRPILLPPDPPLPALTAAAVALLPEEAEPDPGRAAAIGHVLDAILACVGPHQPTALPRDPLVGRAMRLAEMRVDRATTVTQLARSLRLSPDRLSDRFRRVTGQPLKRWLDRRRAEAAAALLAQSDSGLAAIAETLGFRDVFAFSRFFKRVVGSSPSAYRRGLGRG